MKFLVLGDSLVGKSNILLQYTESRFNPYYVSTIGVDFKVKDTEVCGKLVKVASFVNPPFSLRCSSNYGIQV
jgi:Ras-related protein Rab-8A